MAVPSRSASEVAEIEVSPRAGRRSFTIEYKTWVVQEAARLRGSGEIGELLRREGLFSSQLTTWRQQYQAGGRHARSQKRGPKAKPDETARDVTRLESENAKLREQLARAELVIDIQKKFRRCWAYR
ncbi:MAG: transposase [Gemmatimonadaceae bacterium]